MAWIRWRRGSGEGPPYCSFCQLPTTRRRRVIQRADGLAIGDECIDRVLDVLSSSELRRFTRV